MVPPGLRSEPPVHRLLHSPHLVAPGGAALGGPAAQGSARPRAPSAGARGCQAQPCVGRPAGENTIRGVGQGSSCRPCKLTVPKCGTGKGGRDKERAGGGKLSPLAGMLTKSKLKYRHLSQTDLCSLCNEEQKTEIHLFNACRITKLLYHQLRSLLPKLGTVASTPQLLTHLVASHVRMKSTITILS